MCVVFAAGACARSDTPRDRPAVPGAASEGTGDRTLDCVTESYPRTWAEVSLEAVERTETLADEAVRRLESGETTDATADWLLSQPDIGTVLHDSLMVRFRLAEGRPVWVSTPEAARLGMRAVAPPPLAVQQQSSRQADPVGKQTPGVRPEKSVLFVDPYRWEFYTDVLAGNISAGDDASNSLPTIFGRARDYNCTPGEPCACPAGQCFNYVGNDWQAMCDPASPSCNIVENVALADFKSWGSYDVIHVASHGTQLCNGPLCSAAIASGRLVRGDVKAWAETMQLAGYPPPGADWLTEPGIELYLVGLPSPFPATPLSICNRLTSGTPGYTYALCDSGQRSYREYLGLDFFRAAYAPGDLKDKLIFLSSCSSVAGAAPLAKYLAGPGNENAVVGWTDLVSNGSASRAATVFYEEWLKGRTAHEAFLAVTTDVAFMNLAFVGGRGLLRGGASSATLLAQASPATEGLAHKRGVETIHLLDPATGLEVADGGTIPLFTQPGDGQADTLDAMIEVVSVDAAEAPAEYLLRVRIDGQDAPGTARLNLDRGNGTHRYRGSIDLGVDLRPGVAIPVEVSADLPAGGETRWLYYDLVPDACIVPRQGQYAGDLGGPLARHVDPNGRGAFAKILRSPLGGWGLQIEAREPGLELNFLVQLPDDPEPGATVTVSDAGLADFKIGGGVRNPEQVNWASGNLQVQYSRVAPQAGKPFSWVCGTISGTLVGIKDPPPGSMTPIQVPATFRGLFWAEWHH